jgi:hypothetical protein
MNGCVLGCVFFFLGEGLLSQHHELLYKVVVSIQT